MPFQSVVNIQQSLGNPGNLFDNSPWRATRAALVSSSYTYNVIGATAYTVVSGDPGDNSAPMTVQAGGTGAFAGILMNPDIYSNNGTAQSNIAPNMTLPNYTIGSLLISGTPIVTLPGPANVGDLVAYDLTTGALSTYPANTVFTGAIAASTGVLTVSALTAGQIQVGLQISGTGIPPGIYITSFGTGLGGAGTYNTNYTTATAIASTTITAASKPPVAASFTAAISTAGLMTVSAVSSGYLAIGQVIYGNNVPQYSVITAFGTGTGGTGTYQLSQSPTTAITSEAMTADATALVPNASVYYFPASGGGIGVIRI